VEDTRILLDIGANVNYVIISGSNPLARAAYNGNLILVKLLLERDTDSMNRNNNKISWRLARE
jgi:ankyrin repeat protein